MNIKKILIKAFIFYFFIVLICFFIAYFVKSEKTDWVSFLGSYFGGILGGCATLIAIIFTIASLKQDVLPCVIPMRTIIYGYSSIGKGAYLSANNIVQKDVLIDEKYENTNEPIQFNPFNQCFMKFANIGKGCALNIKIDWSNAFDSELYDILLEYGFTHAYFEEHFNTTKTETLYKDCMFPIADEPESCSVQIPNELIELFIYSMHVLDGSCSESAIDENHERCFGNNFVRKKQKFAIARVTYEDLNGDFTTKEYTIYCRIQRQFGTYNRGYKKIKIELSNSPIIN